MSLTIEQAGERRVERAIQVERAGGEGVGFRVDEMDDPVTHLGAPVRDRVKPATAGTEHE
jgi:hypothetical protein